MAKKATSTKRKTTSKSKTTTKRKPAAKKPAAKKTATKKPAAKKAVKTAVKKPAAKKTVKKAVKKPATKKPAAKKTAIKKPAAKKPAAKKTATKKPAAKKPAAKKTAARKPAARKPAAKKTVRKEKSNVVAIKSPDAFDPTQLEFVPYVIHKDEDYMNGEQRNHFSGLLQGWKLALMEKVDRTVSHLQDEPNNLADPSDRATQEEEFALELRARDRERKLINKIDKTLDQINQNDYGYCEQCGEEIGIRRLEARPTADLCIDCKTLAEIKEKHYSS